MPMFFDTSKIGMSWNGVIPVFKPRTMLKINAGASEETEQIYIFCWAEGLAHRYPILERLYHVPNGGARSKAVAGKLKAAGVKSGVPDIDLPAARGGYYGLHIELKAGKNKIEPKQREWLEHLTQAGRFACVCYGADAATEIIERYLNGHITKA